jgi:hypothetical protein
VRRISAIVLLALFSFSLIGPALLSADSDSNLPACCRRDGKHHCSSMSGSDQTSSSGPSFKSGETCPFFPGSFITPTGSDTFIPVVSAAASVPHADRSPVQFSTQASGHSYLDRSHQKRGPPFSPSFA